MITKRQIAIAIIGLAILGTVSLNAQVQKKEPSTFGTDIKPTTQIFKAEDDKIFEEVRETSLGLVKSSTYFSGGNGSEVAFDSVSARKQGLSEKEIVFAEELKNFTNDIVRASDAKLAEGNPISVAFLDVNVEKYPSLAEYFELTQYLVKTDKMEKLSESIATEDSYVPGLSEFTCGCFWRPLPVVSAPRVGMSTSNPAQYLRNSGYHEPPSWLQRLGWTRPKTYKWWICGFDTYRDNAAITGSTRLWRQEYSGSPNGEPNPELWRIPIQPYPYWAAYVYWWHEIRNL